MLLLNSFSLIASWRTDILKKEQPLKNSHKSAVFLVYNSYVSDPGLRFGKVQTDLDYFYSKFIATGNIQTIK